MKEIKFKKNEQLFQVLRHCGYFYTFYLDDKFDLYFINNYGITIPISLYAPIENGRLAWNGYLNLDMNEPDLWKYVCEKYHGSYIMYNDNPLDRDVRRFKIPDLLELEIERTWMGKK